MRKLFVTALFVISTVMIFGQHESVSPGIIKTAAYFDVSPPLSDLPPLTADELEVMKEKALKKAKNKGLGDRVYPFADRAFPQGPDEVWQKQMGNQKSFKAPVVNFNGQSSPYFPPDCNGDVGPNHYFQTVNTTYSIYDKTGVQLVAPTAMNTLFSGVTGATENDGDPIILYDEHADRWMAAEFSIGSNDYMLIAVSTTPDPTGTWYRWSFDVDDMPDYMKFGIQRDGYYMSTNTYSGLNNAYVFERDVMLAGGSSPQMVGFPNPWRPSGFHCIQPIDCDDDFPPVGVPGQFITINDDAIGGGNDELRVFELDVNWTSPASSTFILAQQLPVVSFDSEFNAWGVGDITQPGTTQLLDAIPMVLMYRAQYRNFNTSQNIVCMHTVDVDATNHAGIRWYELQNTSGTWSIRQQGTYAPDAHSRWMGSIAMNASHAIGLGYTVSSSTVYPSLRYCGQSPSENANATGVLDIAEEVIQAGTSSQTSYNRWGDYSFMSVDPTDNNTFWYTSEYIGSGGSRQTRIASFELTDAVLTSDFYANSTSVCDDGTVSFFDASLGTPSSWSWSFLGGSPASSTLENPIVTYNTPGVYNVTLLVGDGSTTNNFTKNNYINVQNVIADFSSSSLLVAEGGNLTFTNNSSCDPTAWNWTFDGGIPSSFSGPNPPAIEYNTTGNFDVSLEVIKGGYSDTKVIPIEVIPLSFCTPTYSTGTGAGDYISLVQLEGINNITGALASPYYQYYSGMSADLTQGENYTITLSPGTYSSGNYIAVWIDYNRDGTFSETSEKLGTVLIDPTPATGTINFTVPANASVVTTRMRVREVWNNSNFDACTSYSYGEAEDYNINILSSAIRLDITAYLEGPFNGTDMNADLIPHLPLSQPFGVSPWNYYGSESVGSFPNLNIVDWVLVDVRDAASAATAAAGSSLGKQAAFILNDGSIVGMDGSSNLSFEVSINQNLYVVIWQRNHLGIISNYAITNSGSLYSYNFSNGINQVYGGANGHKQLTSGVWGMRSGDGDHNGLINNGDKSASWDNQAGTKGYIYSDYNLDAESNNIDKDEFWLPNTGEGSQVPN